MNPWIAELLGSAERAVEGPEFNAASFAAREAAEAAHGMAVAYELSLDGEERVEDFAPAALEKLGEHMEAKRLPREGAPGLLVWVWLGSRAHLFSGRAFADQLRRRLPPPMLPPGP